MDVIKKLNELRLQQDMSVYRLAELSGINQSTLANTFSRGTVPSLKNLELICQALGMTLAQFFSEDEQTFHLSQREARLLRFYRTLPENIKNGIDCAIIGASEK